MKKLFIISIISVLLINMCTPIIFAVSNTEVLKEKNDEIYKEGNNSNNINNTNNEINITEEETEKQEETKIENENDENEEMLINKTSLTYNETIKGRICIDTPLLGDIKEGNAMNVEGWIMTTDANAKVKIYIDGKNTQAQIQRVVREDVLNIIKGYGDRSTNPLPGFKAQINTREYSYGPHSLKVVIEDGQGNEIKEKTIRIIIDNRIKGRMCIDTPLLGDIKEGNAMNVEGWIMTTDVNAKVKIYIDGKDTQAQIQRVVREDVLNIIKGYGGRDTNPLPGFKAQINTKEYNYGFHSLKVTIEDGQGNQIKETTIRIIIDNRVKGRMCIDTQIPNWTDENSLELVGWVMSTDINSTIKVYIDGEDTQAQIQRVVREDVLNIIKGYGDRSTNPLPGFKTTIDLKKYEKGIQHTIKINYVSGDGDIIKSTSTNMIFYSNDIGDLCLDTPTKTVFTGNYITFVGWEMSQLPDSVIKLRVDNKEKQIQITRKEREDVIIAKSKKYGGVDVNPNPGYEITLDISNYSEGIHNVVIELYSKEGKLLDTKQKTISVIKNRYFGIDVSTYQNNINWNLAKSEGVRYAIVRIGWIGNESSKKDNFFEANYNSCIANGIPVGVYVYSYSTSVESARNEANLVLNWLQRRNLQLPVFWDTEDKCQSELDKNTLTAMADTFCSVIESAGYQAGIYGNKWWLTEKLNMDQLENKYDVWVAQYNNECTYDGRYDIWQYSSEGNLSGINGSVDCNWFYKRY